MKKRTYFILKDFIDLLESNEYVNLYDDSGFVLNTRIEDIPNEYLAKEVIKYKVDRAIPNLHFKLSLSSVT